MLAKANTVQAAKQFKDLALTAAEWAHRTKLGREAEQHCREYALRAERRMGEMLAQKPNPSHLDGKDIGGNPRVLPKDTPTLEQLSISKKESANAQKSAKLPEATFEKVAAFRVQKQKVPAPAEPVKAEVSYNPDDDPANLESGERMERVISQVDTRRLQTA